MIDAVKPFQIVDSLGAEWTWTIDDETPPDTSIIVHPPVEIPLGTPVLFTFSSTEPDADFECALYPETAGGVIPATAAQVPATAYSSAPTRSRRRPTWARPRPVRRGSSSARSIRR